MNKQYLTNGINSSPTIAFPAAESMKEIAGKAVKLNEDGKVVLCSVKGERAFGIVTIDNDVEIATDDDVSIQIKDVGVAFIKEDVHVGDELTVDTDGTLVKAAAGDYVAAIAAADCSAGIYGRVQITKYKI